MAFKLIESAQARWRAVNTPHLAAHGVRRGDAQPRPVDTAWPDRPQRYGERLRERA